MEIATKRVRVAHNDFTAELREVDAEVDGEQGFSDAAATSTDGDWMDIERAAYEGALRFGPARHLPSIAACVEHAARKVARWEQRLRAQGTTSLPLETLRSVARRAGKQCAMDAWKSNQRAAPKEAADDEHYDESTLGSLLVFTQIEPLDYQVLLLGELAFGHKTRAQAAPHRAWLGLSEVNYRVKLVRARGNDLTHTYQIAHPQVGAALKIVS